MFRSYLEFVCVVEADLHRRDHPGLEQRTQDTIGYCVGDEMEMKRVSPESVKKMRRLERLERASFISILRLNVILRLEDKWVCATILTVIKNNKEHLIISIEIILHG